MTRGARVAGRDAEVVTVRNGLIGHTRGYQGR